MMPSALLSVLRRYLAPCCCALLLAACSTSVELMGALPESEANEVLAVLLHAGIAAEKVAGKEGMVSVQVDGTKVAKALDALRARGLPRERYAGMGEVFKKEGLISSPLEERVRYLYALSQELSNTISKIDGVVTARVHVVLPERASGGDASTPSSAAVFIKYQEGYNLDMVRPQVRQLVINSIPNLTPDKVAIILVAAQLEAQTGNATSGASPSLPAGGNGTAASGKLETVLGLQVDAASANGLMTILLGLAALALAGLGVLVVGARALLRKRRSGLGAERKEPGGRPGRPGRVAEERAEPDVLPMEAPP